METANTMEEPKEKTVGTAGATADRFHFDLNSPCSIHFIGIGGISMSAIASLLLHYGFTVTGSDSKSSPITEDLEAHGATVFLGQRRSNIRRDSLPDAVVYTAAIHPDNPEFDEAVSLGIPMLTRAQLLGEIMKFYRSSIGIAGTHGKTTTTSMVSTVLLNTDTDPTLFVGGVLESLNGNVRIGANDIFVTESCEYTNSFLSFHPTKEIILNIEADHLDFFKDIDDIRRSFRKFASLLPSKEEGGLLVINREIDNLQEIIEGLPCRVVTFGSEGSGADYTPANVRFDENGCGEFDVVFEGRSIARIKLSVPGEHNVLNALAAFAMCTDEGIAPEVIANSIGNFTGTNRRFQKKGMLGGVTVIDDYAHHPDEIRATLKAAKLCPNNKIWCVFQPHTYTRTKALFDSFVDALSLADEVVLAEIYPARETDTLGMSSALIADALKERGVSARYFRSFDEIEKFLLENCIHGDMLITMGAGNVVDIADSLLGL